MTVSLKSGLRSDCGFDYNDEPMMKRARLDEGPIWPAVKKVLKRPREEEEELPIKEARRDNYTMKVKKRKAEKNSFSYEEPRRKKALTSEQRERTRELDDLIWLFSQLLKKTPCSNEALLPRAINKEIF